MREVSIENITTDSEAAPGHDKVLKPESEAETTMMRMRTDTKRREREGGREG